jgi:sec-independent protein translocase protein TatB
MFDIAFSEIVVIAVVALIVIGPERLPRVARTLGHMFGRLQRYVNEVKADISREMELDELRRLQTEVQSAARDLESSVSNAAREAESGLRTVEAELNESAQKAARDGAPRTDADPERALTEPPADPQHEQSAAARADAPRQGALPGFDRI